MFRRQAMSARVWEGGPGGDAADEELHGADPGLGWPMSSQGGEDLERGERSCSKAVTLSMQSLACARVVDKHAQHTPLCGEAPVHPPRSHRRRVTAVACRWGMGGTCLVLAVMVITGRSRAQVWVGQPRGP